LKAEMLKLFKDSIIDRCALLDVGKSQAGLQH